MPQIPLFVSSSQASTVQNGSCEAAFTPPLHVPEGATDATIHLAHATIPFTEPNVSAALGNNKLVVALPTADGSGSVPEHTTTAQQEVYDNDAKIEFLKACCSNLPSGPSILAKSECKLLVRNAVASMSPRARMAAFRIHRFWRDVCYDPAYAHARALVLRQLDT